MDNFLQELWALLKAYKLRGYYDNGTEAFAFPLSTCLIVLLLLLLIS